MEERDDYLNEFDHWASLAGTDPDAFETLRRRLIDDFIDNAPAGRRERLRCLQWRIDQERTRSHTPLAACIRITRMMWDRVLNPGGLVHQLQQFQDSLRQPGGTEPRRARIIQWPQRGD